MKHKQSKFKASQFFSTPISSRLTNSVNDMSVKYPLLRYKQKISILLFSISVGLLFVQNASALVLPTVKGNQVSINSDSPDKVMAAVRKPNPPTNVIAVPGNAQATVMFTPPTYTGTAPISSYTVTSSPGGIIKTGTASPITVTGLTNGIAYTFTVVATNKYGSSVPSSPSNSVTPATVPSSPTNVTALAGNAQSTVSFTLPTNNGGSAITGYTVTSNPGGIIKTGTANPIIVSGLTNGIAYTFTVVATNAIGSSLPSLPSNSVTPATVPSSPTNVTALAGNAQSTVSFTLPTNNGGSAITGYTVTSNPGNISQSGILSPITVTGLTNGTSYTFTVIATNAVGNSVPSSSSSSVTPATVPDAPTTISAVAGDTQAVVSFYSPSYNGGSGIIGYTVTSNPGNITQTGTSSPLIVTGLTNGTYYTFTVVATNAIGNSAVSAVSNTIIPIASTTSSKTNVALGKSVTVSGTTYSGLPANLVDGILLDLTNTSRWRGEVPSTVDIDFGINQTIASADIYTGYFNGTYWDSQISAFSLQSWNGSSWVNIPDAGITGNTNEHVTFNFASITTQKIRLVTPTGASDFARYMEIQIWTPTTLPQVTVPDAPINVLATSGYSQAIVTFTAPTNFGGTPITSYTVTSNPGNITKTASASPIYFTGLSNGTSYTFTVVATNAVGSSIASSASTVVTPTSQRVLPSVTTQLLSIYQYNRTDLHMLTSIDSLVNSPSSGTISVYKKNNIAYTYTIANIDSIVIVNGSQWSDSLKVALDVTRYGVVGDGTTNNKTNLDNAISVARSASANLYFPNGIYYYAGGMNAQNIRFIGESRNNTTIKDIDVTREHNIDGVENMTLQDFYVSDYTTSLTRTFKNCLFNVTLPVSGSFIQQYAGCFTYGADLIYIDCDFIFPHIWIGLYIRKYNSVLVQNCYFSGSATHNIRLETPNTENANVQILNNIVFGGTTGIFLVSGQKEPLVGGLIQGNKLYSQDEESISMDGYGNDAGMIPVIANGTIASASNDANGRLVISLNNMVTSTATAATVSSRTDWKTFYFLFGAGTGLDGKYIKIYDYNTTDNTLTVDTIISASNVVLTGDAGVESGFFNWTIRGNSVSGTLGTNNTYGTAISLYLNTFGMLVENNTVINCAHGINVAGGNMINNTRTLAFNNLIQNNIFTDCDRYGVSQPSEDFGVIRVISYWGGAGPLQFNNKFINNTVNGGRVYFERQRNFVETGNIYNNVTKLAVDVQ